MQLKDIRELVRILEKSNLNEINIVNGDFEVHLQKSPNIEAVSMPHHYAPMQQMMPAQAPQMQSFTPESSSVEAPVAQKTNVIEIKSPMVGTYYAAPTPESDDFVKVGDKITEDSVVCIVEAMKLFNEIKAEVSGKIVEMKVKNGQPVEYGQVLFIVEPA